MREEDIVVDVVVKQAISKLLDELLPYLEEVEYFPEEALESAVALAKSAAREAYHVVLAKEDK